MHLTRGLLNSRTRSVARDLRDVTELHRTVMSMFPSDLGESPRRQCNVLHRVDVSNTGQAVLVVQSDGPPDLGRLPPSYFIEVDDHVARYPRVDVLRADAIQNGMTLRFRLRANVTRKVETKTTEAGERRNGRRVGVREDGQRVAWLTRKANGGGFTVLADTLAVRSDATVVGTGDRRFEGVRFEGLLRVDDAGAFRGTLVAGIGPAKAFGFGLLSVVGVGSTELYAPANTSGNR